MLLRISTTNANISRNGYSRALQISTTWSLSRASSHCCFTPFGITKLKHKKTDCAILAGNRIQSNIVRINGTNSVRHVSVSLSGNSFDVNEENWREHPSLTETLMIPTIIIPSEHLHSMMSNEGGLLAPLLSSNMEELENIHPRIKQVQNLEKLGISDVDGMHSKKGILLDPKRVGSNGGFSFEKGDELDREDILSRSFPLLNKNIIQNLASKSALPGPMVPISLGYEQQPIQKILTMLLPKEAMPPPTGFEQIGHVVHLNLKEHHRPFKNLIGSVILDRLPGIESVVNKIGEVSGPYRTYNMEFLAGKPDTMIRLNEDGIILEFDLQKVYWCSRLSGERKRLLGEFKDGDVVADAFCGAGAFVIQAAMKRGCTVYANDLNPDAVKYCRENAKKNLKRYSNTQKDKEDDIATIKSKPVVKVTCGDAFDFIQNLGDMEVLPHHVVMNFPLDSASFLAALRWWPANDEMKVVPTVHLYTFARGDIGGNEDNNGIPPRDAAEVAVDLVADVLLPEGGAIEATKYRRSLLDKMGCEVVTREVRDVAPGKVVIYVSFKVTDTLMRIMRGDFVDF